MNTTRCSDNDLGSFLQGLHVLAHTGSTNAGVALDLHEIAKSNDDLLNLLSQLTSGSKNQSLAALDVMVDLLKNGDGESSRLASSRLGLGNHIMALDDGHDGTLLNGRGALETIGVHCRKLS